MFSPFKRLKTAAVGRASPHATSDAVPLCPLAEVLAPCSADLKDLRLASGMKKEAIAEFIAAPIERVAEQVHLVPATRDHHSELGGMIRLCVRSALNALRVAESRMFAGDRPAEQRRVLERRWVYAAFLAGLCYPVGRTLVEQSVRSMDGAMQWNPVTEGLVDWARRNGLQEYRLGWDVVTPEHDYAIFSLVMALRTLPAGCMRYVGEGGRDILNFMLRAIGEQHHQGEHVLFDVVERAYAGAVEKDLSKVRQGWRDTGAHGVAVEHYLIDAVRTLLRTKWRINAVDEPAWNTDQGAFLDLRRCVKDVVAHLRESRVYGVPEDPRTVAEILVERGLAEPYEAQGHQSPYWPIQILDEPALRGRILECIKIKTPELIFGRNVHAPVRAAVGAGPDPSAPSAESIAEPQADARGKDAPEGEQATADEQKPRVERDSTADRQRSLELEGDDAPAGAPAKQALDAQNIQSKTAFSLYGRVGSVLDAIAGDLKRGDIQNGTDVLWVRDGLLIGYPDVIARYGVDPNNFVSDLKNNGWTTSDNKREMIRLCSVAGQERRFVVVTERIGKRLEQAAGVAIERG